MTDFCPTKGSTYAGVPGLMLLLAIAVATLALLDAAPIIAQDSSRHLVGASAPNATGEVRRDEPLAHITRSLYMRYPIEGHIYVINTFHVRARAIIPIRPHL